MAYTEVTHESWGKRLISSVFLIFIGLLMLVGGCVLLFWNEGRAVKTAQALEEGAGIVVSVPDPAQIDSQLEGRLVHMKGSARTGAVLQDAEFGLSVPGIRMQRRVEYYQWVEEEESHEEKELGGGTTTVTTYHYHTTWCDEPVNSYRFRELRGHENTVAYRPQEERAEWLARPVMLGACELNAGQVARVGELRPAALEGIELPEALKGRTVVGGGQLCIGMTPPNPAAPQVGDVRVSWQYVPQEQAVSLVAKQQGNSFVPYIAHSSGYEVDLLFNGLLSAQQVFEKAHEDNTLTTWFLRGCGVLLVFAGLACMTNFISVLGDVIPLVGTLLGFGTFVLSLVGALVISALAVAVAWVWYRPLLSLLLLLLSLLLLWSLRRRKRAAQSA